MRAVLEHCVGGHEEQLDTGGFLIREGETTGRLYVLLRRRLDVLKETPLSPR